MRIAVVYESMYGNTRAIAEAIAEGLQPAEVTMVAVGHADVDVIALADLLVVGGPTHAFGMSRPQTRTAAADGAHKPDSSLTLEPDAVGTGVREWLTALEPGRGIAAAFDTRVKMPGAMGHASRGIGKLLRRRGYRLLTQPQSFFVTKANALRPGERGRARQWGEQLRLAVDENAGQ